MCNQGAFRYYHAETYANDILKGKPQVIHENNFLNQLYESIRGE
jgi:hypothetical protein